MKSKSRGKSRILSELLLSGRKRREDTLSSKDSEGRQKRAQGIERTVFFLPWEIRKEAGARGKDMKKKMERALENRVRTEGQRTKRGGETPTNAVARK